MREVDWPALRADLTERKKRAIDDLPALIDRFTREAEAVGAKVYRAVDAEEARRVVTAICRSKKAKLVVKSKSMATEEIQLNEHLAANGITAVETDLGEWIIQLAGERPSHLIAPAIHKTREEIAALFAKVVGHPVSDDPAALVAIARDELREIVPQSGHRHHRRQHPHRRYGDAGARDERGQRRPRHQPAGGPHRDRRGGEDRPIAGRRRGRAEAARAQRDRPEDQHVHAVHHRALTVRRHRAENADRRSWPERAALRAHRQRSHHDARGPGIQRGAPVHQVRRVQQRVSRRYQVVGGHVFGHIYTGPIGLVVSPFHHGLDSVAYEQQMCMGCNACDTVCPVEHPDRLAHQRRARPSGTANGHLWTKRVALSTSGPHHSASIG